MDLIEKLGLQNPFLLLASSPQTVDAVAQRTIRFAVKHLHDARGETPIRLSPRNAFVQIDQMALINAGRRGVADDKHLGREIITAAIKEYAWHVNRFCFVGMGSFVEIQRCEPVLAVNDQKLLLRVLEMPYCFVSLERLEAELLRREQENRARYGWLANGCFVKVADRSHLRAREPALKSLFVPFNPGDELRHIVLGGRLLGFDFGTFIVKSADETNLG